MIRDKKSPGKIFPEDFNVFFDGREEARPSSQGQICTGGLSTEDSISQYPSIGKRKIVLICEKNSRLAGICVDKITYFLTSILA